MACCGLRERHSQVESVGDSSATFDRSANATHCDGFVANRRLMRRHESPRRWDKPHPRTMSLKKHGMTNGRVVWIVDMWITSNGAGLGCFASLDGIGIRAPAG